MILESDGAACRRGGRRGDGGDAGGGPKSRRLRGGEGPRGRVHQRARRPARGRSSCSGRPVLRRKEQLAAQAEAKCVTDHSVDLPAAGEYQEIARRLDQAGRGDERETVKREIIASLQAGRLALARARTAEGRHPRAGGEIQAERGVDDGSRRRRSSRARGRRFTPIISGASTYIEKGWSLISLGDHAGAIQALQKALQLVARRAQAKSLLGWAQMLHEDYDEALRPSSGCW